MTITLELITDDIKRYPISCEQHNVQILIRALELACQNTEKSIHNTVCSKHGYCVASCDNDPNYWLAKAQEESK